MDPLHGVNASLRLPVRALAYGACIGIAFVIASKLAGMLAGGAIAVLASLAVLWYIVTLHETLRAEADEVTLSRRRRRRGHHTGVAP